MRFTKKLENGSYQVADWVQNENSPEFKNDIIQRLGMFDDYEEMYIKNMVDHDHEKKLAFQEGFQLGCQEMKMVLSGPIPIMQEDTPRFYNCGLFDGSEQIKSEFRELRELFGLSEIKSPSQSEILSAVEKALTFMQSDDYHAHKNPLADVLKMNKRAHALPDLVRGAQALIDSRGDDYCKGFANGLICAHNLIFDSEARYNNVDSEIGHHDVVLYYQGAQEKLSTVTIPVPLTQAEGLARIYDQA